ncbi:MAG: hypothetical protein AMJ92_12055 [candidate division Zixibacteria bacterium SM23_81]|nr:MAG: hypothetical protein AMJ92_12055 [candidate division Zixibacteria bacterium SM23_81]
MIAKTSGVNSWRDEGVTQSEYLDKGCRLGCISEVVSLGTLGYSRTGLRLNGDHLQCWAYGALAG